MNGTSINTLRVAVFHIPLITDEAVLSQVTKLDAALDRSIMAFLPYTDWVMIYLGTFANRIAFVSLRNTKVLVSTLPRSKRPRTDKNALTAADTLYSEDELLMFNALGRLACHYTDRTIEAPSIDALRLFRRTKIMMLEAFLGHAREYRTLSVQLARDHQVGVASSTDFQAVRRIRELEDKVGALPNTMYGVSLGAIRNANTMRKIRSVLCMPYLRKVWSVVRRYIPQSDQRFLALLNIGVMGLITGINCYEAERRTSLGSFAENWIRQHVLEYMKSRLNLITQNPRDIQNRTRVRTALRDMGWENLPTNQKITVLAEHLGMDRRDVIRHLQDDNALSSVVSTHAKYGGEESRTSVGDMIESDHDLEQSAIEDESLRSLIHQLRSTLPESDLRMLFVKTGQENLIVGGDYQPSLRNALRLTLATRAVGKIR